MDKIYEWMVLIILLCSTIAAFRQAFGFTIYTTMIDLINCHIESAFPNHTNFYKFSTAAIVGKAVAILF